MNYETIYKVMSFIIDIYFIICALGYLNDSSNKNDIRYKLIYPIAIISIVSLVIYFVEGPFK